MYLENGWGVHDREKGNLKDNVVKRIKGKERGARKLSTLAVVRIWI